MGTCKITDISKIPEGCGNTEPHYTFQFGHCLKDGVYYDSIYSPEF
jgi:hypothetical protein